MNVQYEKIDVESSPEHTDYVKSLGYSSLPVVVMGEVSWSGFRPDMIQKAEQN